MPLSHAGSAHFLTTSTLPPWSISPSPLPGNCSTLLIGLPSFIFNCPSPHHQHPCIAASAFLSAFCCWELCLCSHLRNKSLGPSNGSQGPRITCLLYLPSLSHHLTHSSFLHSAPVTLSLLFAILFIWMLLLQIYTWLILTSSKVLLSLPFSMRPPWSPNCNLILVTTLPLLILHTLLYTSFTYYVHCLLSVFPYRDLCFVHWCTLRF